MFDFCFHYLLLNMTDELLSNNLNKLNIQLRVWFVRIFDSKVPLVDVQVYVL